MTPYDVGCRIPPATLKPKTQNYENKITLTRTQIGTEDISLFGKLGDWLFRIPFRPWSPL